MKFWNNLKIKYVILLFEKLFNIEKDFSKNHFKK